MDPCPFVRLIVESLALKLPFPTRTTEAYPTSYYCKLRMKNFPTQTVLLPLCSTPNDSSSPPESSSSSPGFTFDSAAIRRVGNWPATLQLTVYSGKSGRTYGLRSGKLMGRVEVVVGLDGCEATPIVFRTGWFKLGHDPDKPLAKLHLVVLSEPDPRFVFQFGGEPECNPVVFQIQGSIRQPVFSCKFSADRNSRSRSIPSDFTSNNNRGWIRSFSSEREKSGRERKGWMIMIYDLSGSPVAAASMITPFVPSPGTNRVSRSNPGAWLILRPYGSSWKPWGRLEVWREKGPIDGLGYKFELVSENGPDARIPIAEATLSVKHGGQFCIDGRVFQDPALNSWSPVKGFVMGSSVEGVGKVSKPVVQVGARHIKCMADAAIFVALSAAIDLSMDACQLFSHKLRKELCLADQLTQ
ncbi:unnamed protein product [Rhodiola kirilowii]